MSYTHNIAKKTPEEQAKIRIDLDASLTAWKLKRGELKKHHVEIKIQQHPAETREYFRQRINDYRGIRRAT